MDAAPPCLVMRRTESEDPTVTKLTTETELRLPTACKPMMLLPDPNRLNERSDSDEPSVAKDRTDAPWPERTMERTLRLEPRWTCDSTDVAAHLGVTRSCPIMETLLPQRVCVRTDNALPMLSRSNTEVFAARTKLRMEMLDPHRRNWITEADIWLPTWCSPNTLAPEPIRTKLRTDSELPKLAKFTSEQSFDALTPERRESELPSTANWITDMCLPAVSPCTEQPDPMRMKVRQDKALPTCMKLSMLTADPQRLMERRLNALPSCTDDSTENAVWQRMACVSAKTLHVLPRRAKARSEMELPMAT
mmetsp:Transcript_12976/g.31665  ORF Transcript_12976/g.31665 Transcript_12976/m.31665 type:complete len:306 (+) Transcript_12976:4136-5053(+)